MSHRRRRHAVRDWIGRQWHAFRNFGRAAHSYVFAPIEGAVARHVNAREFFDVLIAAMATGGLSNALLYLAQHSGEYVHGVEPAHASMLVMILTLIARLVQRYHDDENRGTPLKPA